jgi:hypothetical protein
MNEITGFGKIGPRAPTATTTAFLQEFFGDGIVGCGLWPPRSPDLTPPHFFLWVFLEERVYSCNPRSVEDRKRNTEQAVPALTNRLLEKFKKHCEECKCLSSIMWGTFLPSAVIIYCLSHSW